MKEPLGHRSCVVPLDRFDNTAYIEKRVSAAPVAAQGSLRTALKYLYLGNGPRNLGADRKKTAESFLEPAEIVIIKWLFPRTNGQYRKSYGFPALSCARSARFRCQACGQADVRVLEFDHVEGRVENCTFACLCANCHKIKSRKQDWTGKARNVAPPQSVG